MLKKSVITMSLAGLLLGAAPAVWAQAGETPQAPAPPAPGQRERVPGPDVRMRMPGPGGPMAPAPGPRRDLGKWWKNSEIAKELGLTEQQITQIEQTFFDHRMKLIDMNADVQRNEARLQPLMEADQVDEAKISAQLDQLLTARSRLEKANMMMMISIRKVLAVEQWKKLEEIRERRGHGLMRAPFPDGPEGPEAPHGMMKRQAPRPPEDERP